MNCAQFDKLIDAHLDGRLSGTLRLEFDAHRVNCAACEHSVALMEAVASYVAQPDPRAPQPPIDLTDSIMATIATRKKTPKPIDPYHGTKVALTLGGMFQAAAVLALVLMPAGSNRIPISTPPEKIELASVTPDALTRYIYESVAARMVDQGGPAEQVAQMRQLALNFNPDAQRPFFEPIGLLQAFLPTADNTATQLDDENQFTF